MLPHLTAVPRVHEVVRQRYNRAISPEISFKDLPVLAAIHTELYSGPRAYEAEWSVMWEDYKPSSDEHVVVAGVLAEISQDKYRRSEPKKVPEWFLRFAHHSLSQSPLPPTSVVVNSLSIIAIDLGYDSSTTAALDERCVRT